MNDQHWYDIPRYEGFYQITKGGDIRSVLPDGRTKSRKPYRNRRGYLSLRLYRRTVARFETVHRLLAETFIPQPEGKSLINHRDGNKLNNQLDNLEWCTHSENNLHAFRLGLNLGPYGTRQHGAKLSDNDVRHIRALSASGMSAPKIASLYPVTAGSIWLVVTRRTWRHIH